MSNLQTYLFAGLDREGFKSSEVYYAESLDLAKGIFFKRYNIDDEVATVVSIIHAPSESSVPGPANEEVVTHLGGTDEEEDE
jgi:hypothetical protein